MRFASLFAGVGGFDLAFERAGMECVAQIEIDTRCREVLANHWPDIPRFGDVHELKFQRDGTGILASGNSTATSRRGEPSLPSVNGHSDGSRSGDVRNLGPIDLLCGGFPCQDYSVAGKRGGLVGDRGALWWQFHRLIAECRPRWVVGENVPGLLSSNSGRDFGAIVGSLVELGYGVVWRVLDAQYFGVAQRRRRVFIVGHIGGQPRPEVLAFAEGCTGNTPPRREAGQRVAALTANGLGGGGPDDNLAQVGHLIPSVYHKSSMDAGWELGVRTLRARDYKADSHVVIGPLTSGSMSHTRGTETTDSGHIVALNSSVRRLTSLECERLQGFPDNWTASQSDTQRYRQMGNAVAVPVAEWIGRRLVAA